jgi:nucleotide-binding universal stress UspA family protein
MPSACSTVSSSRWICHRHRWTRRKPPRIADALDLPTILAYVIEPIRTPLAARLHLTGIQGNRRAVAEDRLKDLLAIMPQRLHPEALLAYGDPAEELAKLVNDRQVGLIVVGLHGSPLFGPRMGSVTYRIVPDEDPRARRSAAVQRRRS